MNIFSLFMLVLLSVFSGYAYTAEQQPLILKSLNIDGLTLVNECAQGTFGETGAEPILWFSLSYGDRARRRCELAIHNWLKRDGAFDISFEFRVIGDARDEEWLSIFQIHSFPDSGESWRCPIMALEIVGSNLRMFNRWDLQKISDTSVSTCANAHSSMASNTLIQDANFKLGEWQHFRIKGMMSLTNNGYISVELNKEQVGEYQGPTTFNDQRQPYLKLGLYKPTSWSMVSDYRVEYRHVSLCQGRTP